MKGSVLCESRAECPELWDAVVPNIEVLVIVIVVAIAAILVYQIAFNEVAEQ